MGSSFNRLGWALILGSLSLMGLSASAEPGTRNRSLGFSPPRIELPEPAPVVEMTGPFPTVEPTECLDMREVMGFWDEWDAEIESPSPVECVIDVRAF